MSIFNVLDILNRRNLLEKHTKIFKINSKYRKLNCLINKIDLRANNLSYIDIKRTLMYNNRKDILNVHH